MYMYKVSFSSRIEVAASLLVLQSIGCTPYLLRPLCLGKVHLLLLSILPSLIRYSILCCSFLARWPLNIPHLPERGEHPHAPFPSLMSSNLATPTAGSSSQRSQKIIILHLCLSSPLPTLCTLGIEMAFTHRSSHQERTLLLLLDPLLCSFWIHTSSRHLCFSERQVADYKVALGTHSLEIRSTWYACSGLSECAYLVLLGLVIDASISWWIYPIEMQRKLENQECTWMGAW
jgi:hypothetical protein